MNTQLSSFLKDIKDAVLRQEFVDIGTVKVIKKGETVVQDGSYVKSIPIILRGSLKVVQEDDEGREFLLYYLSEGESCIMSILSSLNNETSKVRVIAEKEAELLMIPIQNAAIWVKKHPAWAEYIFKLYQKRFEELLSVVKRVSSKSLSERVKEALAHKSRVAQSNELAITHQQLADELGTARVVVSRLLKDMEHEGAVKLSRNRITILSLV